MSTTGGEAADEVVRMVLSGTEVMVRLTASATKNLLALSIALAKNHKKICGKTSLKKMLRETRDIRVFSMTNAQFRQFEKQAKKFGLLYASIRDNGPDGKLVDLILPATELSRANTVFEKIRYGQEQSAAEQPAPSKDKDANEKNAPRSGRGSRDTRRKEVSNETSGNIRTTNDPPSVEARLETYRVQLSQKRVPAKQRSAIQEKRMAHKKNQSQR